MTYMTMIDMNINEVIRTNLVVQANSVSYVSFFLCSLISRVICTVYTALNKKSAFKKWFKAAVANTMRELI